MELFSRIFRYIIHYLNRIVNCFPYWQVESELDKAFNNGRESLRLSMDPQYRIIGDNINTVFVSLVTAFSFDTSAAGFNASNQERNFLLL